MASFYSVFGFLAVSAEDSAESVNFDLLGCLPLEITIAILRLLPGKDLWNAARVSRRWLEICKGDSKLRRKVRRHLRAVRKARITLVQGDRAKVTRNIADNMSAMRIITNQGVHIGQAPNMTAVNRTSGLARRFKPYEKEASFKHSYIKAGERIGAEADCKRRNMRI